MVGFVPKEMFFTKGVGKHREKLTSFELALRSAGIAGQSFVAPGEDPFDVGNMVATVRIGYAILMVSSVLVAAAAVLAIALVTKVNRAMAQIAPPEAPAPLRSAAGAACRGPSRKDWVSADGAWLGGI